MVLALTNGLCVVPAGLIMKRKGKKWGKTFNAFFDNCTGKRKAIVARKGGLLNWRGQAIKGARRMPWRWEAMKDAASCDKPRVAASRR